jgi:catechol 2,3-dioxygenase-like lactoylglutathione lyase family enzyme
MIDHVGVSVADTKRSKAFYDAALALIGITMIMEVPGGVTASGGTACGYGKDGKPFFWFGDNVKVGTGFHIAFAVDRRKHRRCSLSPSG